MKKENLRREIKNPSEKKNRNKHILKRRDKR